SPNPFDRAEMKPAQPQARDEALRRENHDREKRPLNETDVAMKTKANAIEKSDANQGLRYVGRERHTPHGRKPAQNRTPIADPKVGKSARVGDGHRWDRDRVDHALNDPHSCGWKFRRRYVKGRKHGVADHANWRADRECIAKQVSVARGVAV